MRGQRRKLDAAALGQRDRARINLRHAPREFDRQALAARFRAAQDVLIVLGNTDDDEPAADARAARGVAETVRRVSRPHPGGGAPALGPRRPPPLAAPRNTGAPAP